MKEISNESENEWVQSSGTRIAGAFVDAGLPPLREASARQFAVYLDLLQRWNGRLNLTAVRDPEEIIQRHFVESAFAVEHLPADAATVLDFGSGAGFPGIPIAICAPRFRMTLAESQTKKVSFLREVVRTTGLSCEIYDGRVETMKDRRFDCVVMRAVERMGKAVALAGGFAEKSLILFATDDTRDAFMAAAPGFSWEQPVVLPGSSHKILMTGHRQ